MLPPAPKVAKPLWLTKENITKRMAMTKDIKTKRQQGPAGGADDGAGVATERARLGNDGGAKARRSSVAAAKLVSGSEEVGAFEYVGSKHCFSCGSALPRRLLC